MGRGERFAKIAAALFSMNPLGFYHSIFYSESLFLFIYLACLLHLYERQIIKNEKISEMSFFRFLGLSIIFSTAGFVRSIGFMNAAHICYPLLLEIFEVWVQPQTLLLKKISKTLKCLVRILTASLLFLAPFVIIQYSVYSNYCKGYQNPPSFCSNRVPDFYSFVQLHYWKVEYFSFIKQGHYEEILFIYFSFIIWLVSLLKFVNENSNLISIPLANVPYFLKNGCNFAGPQIINFPSFVIVLILGCFSFGKANLCSVDRFLSAIPFYYIMLAEVYDMTRRSKWLKLAFVHFMISRFGLTIFSFSTLWQPA